MNCHVIWQDNEGHTASDFDYKPPDVLPADGSIVPDKEL